MAETYDTRKVELMDSSTALKPGKPFPFEGRPLTGLLSASMGGFIGMASVALFGPAMPLIKQKLGLGPMEASWLIASPVLSGSLLRILAGPLADSFGAVKVMALLLTVCGLGVLGAAGVMEQLGSQSAPLPGEYSGLLFLGVLAGFGAAGFPVGVGQASYWYPKESQGSVLGLYGGLISMAPALVSLAMPFALSHFGFALTYYTWFALVAIGMLAYRACAKNSWYFQLLDGGIPQDEARELALAQGQQMFPSGSAWIGLRTAVGIWKTWALVSIYFLAYGGWITLTGWFPTYWHERHGVALTTAGSLTALYSWSTTIVRATGGLVSDRIGGELTILAGLSFLGTGASMLTMSSDFNVDVAGQMLMALGAGLITNAVFKLVPQEVPQAVGGAAGLVGGLGCFGGFTLTPVLAFFAHHYGTEGLSHGFIIFVVLAVMNTVVATVVCCSSEQDDSDCSSDSDEGFSSESQA